MITNSFEISQIEFCIHVVEKFIGGGYRTSECDIQTAFWYLNQAKRYTQQLN